MTKAAETGDANAGSTVILIADDHPLFRDALRIAVRRAVPDARILEADTVAGTISIAQAETQLDLVLLDLKMPDSSGFEGLARLVDQRPDTTIIVVTAAEGVDAAARTKAFGASGFLSKSASLEKIEETILLALSGAHDLLGETMLVDRTSLDEVSTRISSLTPTQLRVLRGLMAGQLNKQIAFDMDITEATVKAHMTTVFRKLNVRNRTQAVLVARAAGIDEQSA
jgi:DNA-binding NarL/FixJ family response regulator